MKKHSLLKSLLLLLGMTVFGSISAQITFQGVTDSTAIVDEDFTANVLYTVEGGSAPTFSLPLSPGGMNINSSGVITYHPASIYSGGRVVVRAVNNTGTYEYHFNLYVSDAIACSPDLISYFKFNEAGGTTFADFQGGPNATSVNTLGAATGRVDGSVVFSPPSNDYDFITIPDMDQYEWTVNDDFSFAVWIYSFGKPGWAQFLPYDQVIFYCYGTDVNFVFGLDGQDQVGDTLKPKIKLKPNTDPELTMVTNLQVTANTWHHMAFSYDALGGGGFNLRVYFDGAKVENPGLAFSNTGNFYFDQPMHIGWYSLIADYNVPFNGRMDEVLIYNKALTDVEIANIYSEGLAGEEHCKPGNHAPEFINNFPSGIDQGGTYFVQLATYDIESDPVQIDTASIPNWMQYNSTLKRLTNKSGRPDNDDVGAHNVVLTAYDGTVQVTRSYPITVVNVNDPPAFTSSQGNTTINEDTEFSYSITYEDIDVGDVVTLTAPTIPSWLTLNTGTNTLSGTPTNDDLGYDPSKVFPVVLRVTDLSSAYTEQSFNITVNNVNDPPVITGQDNIYTDENIPITITPEVAFTDGVNITDVDDIFPTDFTLTVSAGTNYTVTPPNTVNPAANFSGILNVPITLSDGQANVPYTLFVNVNFVNEIPYIEPVYIGNDTLINEYQLFEETFVAYDDDPQDVPVMNDSILPHWLTFVPETGYMSGTPGFEDVGDTIVILTVSDGHVTVPHMFTITVADHNYPPEITSIPEEEWHVGTVYQYNLTATDTNEDDNLTFTAIEKPDWLNFEVEATQALLHGLPTEENIGEHDIMLQVSDGTSIDQQSFTLTISLTGIEDNMQGTILVYPIPATNKVYFDYSGIVNGTLIEIVNLSGSRMISKVVEDNTGKMEMDISGFEAGLYIYRIIENDHITTGKLIIE